MENTELRTHKVIDTNIAPSDGNLEYVGSYEACVEYRKSQQENGEIDAYTLQIDPLSDEEIELYNDEDEYEDEKQFIV